jgi:hypothetical protein
MSNGRGGHDAEGRMKMLFEPDVFYRNLARRSRHGSRPRLCRMGRETLSERQLWASHADDRHRLSEIHRCCAFATKEPPAYRPVWRYLISDIGANIVKQIIIAISAVALSAGLGFAQTGTGSTTGTSGMSGTARMHANSMDNSGSKTMNPNGTDQTKTNSTTTSNSAKGCAPGQQTGNASQSAPGHQTGSASQSAPGQQKKVGSGC